MTRSIDRVYLNIYLKVNVMVMSCHQKMLNFLKILVRFIGNFTTSFKKFICQVNYIIASNSLSITPC